MTLLIEELDKVIQSLKNQNINLQEENTKLKEGVREALSQDEPDTAFIILKHLLNESKY